MRKILHTHDNGLMDKNGENLKCNLCGYLLKQSEITSAYISGKISISPEEG